MALLPGLHRKLDLVGFVLFAPAAIQLLLALQYGGNEFPWHSSTVIGLFCGAGATFVAFLAWNWHKGDEALIPVAMVRKRVVVASCVCVLFMMGMTFLVSYFLPIYFQTVRGVSPLISGVHLLPTILPQILAAVVGGWAGMSTLHLAPLVVCHRSLRNMRANVSRFSCLVGKVGYYTPFAIGGSALVAIGNGLLSSLSPTTSTGRWVGYQVIMGVGRGVASQIVRLFPLASSPVLCAPAPLRRGPCSDQAPRHSPLFPSRTLCRRRRSPSPCLSWSSASTLADPCC